MGCINGVMTAAVGLAGQAGPGHSVDQPPNSTVSGERRGADRVVQGRQARTGMLRPCKGALVPVPARPLDHRKCIDKLTQGWGQSACTLGAGRKVGATEWQGKLETDSKTVSPSRRRKLLLSLKPKICINFLPQHPILVH